MIRLSSRRRESGASERLELDPRTPWWGEHRSRYLFARPHARGARVLDIACGSGFGVAMLAEAGACLVVGSDLVPGVVKDAGERFGGRGRRFVASDGTRLPFADACFDLITSFETVEHIPAAGTFLAELRRVIAPGGVLVLSTPNRDYTELNGHKCTNPFHVHEYTKGELQGLLARHFRGVELVGQRHDPVYRTSPFYSDHVRARPTLLGRARLLGWKVQNRLPFSIKEFLSQIIHGRPFYPSEEHYLFGQEQIESAPVLVATCRP